ncbi:outer membrane lipoprotein-sorting protein [bacterium]|nr:outer membrane lipoprotein-sorting protein [bacterium]
MTGAARHLTCGLCGLLVSGLVAASPALAAEEETARQILDRQRALDEGARRWSDRHQRLAMEVVTPEHAPRSMTLDLFDKKTAPGEQRTIAFFSAPASARGTAFLGVTHPDRAADQWLYLPELRRARRVGGAARHSGFVGTDLTYHDLDLLAEMPHWSEADATAARRGEETIDGVPCHVIELTPVREDIGYQRIVLWLGRDDLVARRVDLHEQAPARGWFGRGGDAMPTRRIEQRDIRRVGAIPVPFRAEVHTPAAGSRTIISFERVTFDLSLPDELFTQPALEWGSYAPGAR